MKTITVAIRAAGVPIGIAALRSSDPTMGVAMGIFEPNAAYVPELHASQTEAFEANALELELWDEVGAPMPCAGVYLVDFSQTLGDDGRELHALGIEGYQTKFPS